MDDFLQPQNVMAAEADEIIKELDFTDINAQTQDLPERWILKNGE